MSEAASSDERAGRVVSVHENLVRFTVPASGLRRNEVVLVHAGEARLKSEVLRILGEEADAQVFEDTAGVHVGAVVERTEHLLSVELGPGLLGQVFDGLQTPLHELAERHGFFLPRGAPLPALDPERRWAFTPTAQADDVLRAGDRLGTVPEGRFDHPITVPFDLGGEVRVHWIDAGSFRVDEPVARVVLEDGTTRDLTLKQRWPVRRPLPEELLLHRRAERQYPDEPMVTTTRVIDTFFPIAKGGTAAIPGPFGAGKTVLQGLLARFSDVDVVVVVACGERAGEVVETITDFPQLPDPRTGGTLMDRTIIIANTSSMPVAAREASVYTGTTIGEYYRQLGYDVLLIADSTSRWAQAMRETSGRLEEIPGEEAFPAYLDSAIKGLYDRAGVLQGPLGTGSLTMVGTVSPAGGNFEEPVTQSTLGTVKTFLGLSYDRAYKRYYPAIDPLISWSRYHDQLEDYFERTVEPRWRRRVAQLIDVLRQGHRIEQMMQVTGEEGISLQDVVTMHRARLVDLVYLQQDAFDEVDASCPLDRQAELLDAVVQVLEAPVGLADREAVREAFTGLIGAFRNANYASRGSAPYREWMERIVTLREALA